MLEIDNVWSNTLETEFSKIPDLLTGLMISLASLWKISVKSRMLRGCGEIPWGCGECPRYVTIGWLHTVSSR